MCVIVITPDKQHRPDIKTLHACAEANPHGSGFAWIEAGKVHYLKGLSVESIAKNLRSLNGPAIVHFRISTAGGIQGKLCHPFPVAEVPAAKWYGSAKQVLFHNGHWSGWEDWKALSGLKLKGPISDTRVAAAAVWQYDFEWLKQVGGSNKFALFDHKGAIKTIGQFTEVGGCQFSNTSWDRRWSPAMRPIGRPLYAKHAERIAVDLFR